jgi:hypothetical protein
MSLLSREHGTVRRGRLAATALVAAMAGTWASAAEIYYQPIVTLSSAYNTNVDLEPTNGQGATGYFADAATTIGIATLRSDTTLQPRLLYNYYPSVARRNRLEAFLSGNTHYNWQRDKFDLVGFFDHRDDVNAEQPGAQVDAVNPGVDPTTGTTGRTQLGVIRNYLLLDPTYTHLLSPLSSIGFAAEYQGMRYSPSDQSSHTDFNYYRGRLFYSKTLNLRTGISVGVFGDRYGSTSIDSHSNSGGVQLDGGYNWTETIHSSLTLLYQRTKFEETDPKVFSQTSNTWGATFGTVYKGQLSSYRFNIGRTIYPGSAGGLYTTDQVRAQYDRDFTQRLHFTGAVRFFRDRTTVSVLNSNTRNYLTGNLSVKYMMTPRLFVAGAYTYINQKYHSEIDSAEANVIMLSFGYTGLQRQH